MKRSAITTILLVFTVLSVLSQEKQKKMELNGYLTIMQNAIFDSISGPVFYDNILHNRLNFKGFLNDHLTFAAEFRNRLFTGDMVKSYPGYQEMTTADAGWIDMSWNIIERNTFFINSTIDRLWIDLNYEKFQVRIGRQRINWGQTFVWNPNDIFNAYSFFDVDYIERPGSDAVRLQYYPTWSSSVEVAVKADNNNDITAAGLYRFSKWGYDIQFLAGYSNSSDIVAGAGWSGTLGSASFRGEGTWFHPLNSLTDTTGITIITAGVDRNLKDNSMAQFQLMYCNNPLDLKNFTNLYAGNLSAKDLAFSKFSAFGQFIWAASPLWKISLSAMWFPDLDGYFAGPSVEFSMAENVDSSVFWQHFDGNPGDSDSRINLVFLRIKYSF
jgi:hypothetical protein